jgi:hypothetical protein
MNKIQLIAGCGCFVILVSSCFIGVFCSATYWVMTSPSVSVESTFGGPLRDRWRDRRDRGRAVAPEKPDKGRGWRLPILDNLADNKSDRKETRRQKIASRGKLGQGILMAGGGAMLFVIAIVILISAVFPKK